MSSAHRHCRPESFCASGKFLHVFTKLPIECSLLKSKQVWKVLDSLESFRTVWKVWKLSRRSGKFPDSMESFQKVWKVSRRSGKFPDCPESFQTVWKFSESNLRTFGVCMLRKRFPHFWHMYVAETNYALRPESFCA